MQPETSTFACGLASHIALISTWYPTPDAPMTSTVIGDPSIKAHNCSYVCPRYGARWVLMISRLCGVHIQASARFTPCGKRELFQFVDRRMGRKIRV